MDLGNFIFNSVGFHPLIYQKNKCQKLIIRLKIIYLENKRFDMTTGLNLRQATLIDMDRIWEILEQAISKRKNEGSTQWQDGYPNKNVVRDDIQKGFGYVINDPNNEIFGYVAIATDGEPAYDQLVGNWLSNQPYLVIHRLAIAQDITIKGVGTWLMKESEKLALSKDIHSIKVDTNFDNIPMLRIFEKLGYQYCGEVFYEDGARKAFEKIF